MRKGLGEMNSSMSSETSFSSTHHLVCEKSMQESERQSVIKSIAEEYNIDEKALFNAVINRFGFDYNREQAERVAKEMSNGA